MLRLCAWRYPGRALRIGWRAGEHVVNAVFGVSWARGFVGVMFTTPLMFSRPMLPADLGLPSTEEGP